MIVYILVQKLVYFASEMVPWLEWAINMQLANPNKNIITKKYQPHPLKEGWKGTDRDRKAKKGTKHKRTKITNKYGWKTEFSK